MKTMKVVAAAFTLLVSACGGGGDTQHMPEAQPRLAPTGALLQDWVGTWSGTLSLSQAPGEGCYLHVTEPNKRLVVSIQGDVLSFQPPDVTSQAGLETASPEAMPNANGEVHMSWSWWTFLGSYFNDWDMKLASADELQLTYTHQEYGTAIPSCIEVWNGTLVRENG